MDHTEAGRLAAAYDERLGADDPRFARSVVVHHAEGSFLHFAGAFLVELDDRWVACFTEHHRWFVWERECLERYEQLESVRPERGLAPFPAVVRREEPVRDPLVESLLALRDAAESLVHSAPEAHGEWFNTVRARLAEVTAANGKGGR